MMFKMNNKHQLERTYCVLGSTIPLCCREHVQDYDYEATNETEVKKFCLNFYVDY